MLDVRLMKHIVYAIEQTQNAIRADHGFSCAPENVTAVLDEALELLGVALNLVCDDAE